MNPTTNYIFFVKTQNAGYLQLANDRIIWFCIQYSYKLQKCTSSWNFGIQILFHQVFPIDRYIPCISVPFSKSLEHERFSKYPTFLQNSEKKKNFFFERFAYCTLLYFICLMNWVINMLHNLPYFWHMRIHIFFTFFRVGNKVIPRIEFLKKNTTGFLFFKSITIGHFIKHK